jgi:TetR/AcrR family transcriptional regulator
MTVESRARRIRRRPEVARAQIIAAASHVFADQGFDGARLEDIAERAACNVSLIYHYFENKEDLFISVLERAYDKMRDYQLDDVVRHKDPLVAMREFVRARFKIFLDNPELVGLLNAENVHKAVHIARSDVIRGLYAPLIASLDSLLKRGARAGAFRDGVDPVDLFITVNAIGYFYLSNRYTLGVVLASDLTEPERIRQREEHMVEVVLSYLRPRSSIVK